MATTIVQRIKLILNSIICKSKTRKLTQWNIIHNSKISKINERILLSSTKMKAQKKICSIIRMVLKSLLSFHLQLIQDWMKIRQQKKLRKRYLEEIICRFLKLIRWEINSMKTIRMNQMTKKMMSK